MKLKSLLFGSAAVIAAGTGAQAADLPTVEPVEYVRICDAFGTGFYYVPGTDTCIKIGGRVRAESHYVDGDPDNEQFNNWTSRARGAVKLDGRTQTEIGLIRAYIEFQFTVGPSSSADTYTGTDTNLNHAYIQVINDWGTYTVGHTGSFFDIFGSNTYGTRVAIDDPTGEATLFAWTFAAGNGFSFTVSAEDPASKARKFTEQGAPAPDGGTPGFDGLYGGQEFPDGVANIRVDQGWGSIQIMGAVHEVVSFIGGVGDDLGWAVGAGFSFGVPGTGLTLEGQGAWSEGAIAYVTSCPTGFAGGVCSDGDLDGGTDGLAEAWSVRAGLTASISPTLTAHVDGSYTEYENVNGGHFVAADFESWAVAANLVWEPAPGLTMGPEVAFQSIDFGTPGTFANFSSVPDTDVWGVMWRVNRDFGW
jgi:hypothetical protein